MMKAMWGQWIKQPISASVISNSFIGKLVCLEGPWWGWSSWIHCAVEQFLGNSPNIKTKSFHTRKSPTVTSWGWRCCAKFLSHFSLFLCPWALLFLSWMSSEKSSSTLATGIAGESRLFKHKEVKSWLMPTWFAQSCPTRLSFMINDSNMFWRCANLDLPSFTANSMKEPRTRIRGYVCDVTKTILGCDRIGWRMWRCVPITCGPQQVSLKCTSWQKTKPESLSFRLKYRSIFLLWCKTHVLATIHDGTISESVASQDGHQSTPHSALF